MKIVHAASEMYPYVKTGGLADAVGSLAGVLADQGHEVWVFLPGYRAVLDHPDTAKASRRVSFKIEMGDHYESGEVRMFTARPRLRVCLICRDEYFDRQGLYGNGDRDYEDNPQRFIFFLKGVVEAMRRLEISADVVHGHDWQAALLPLMVRYAERTHDIHLANKTVFTIHNIAFQGIFPMPLFACTNLPADLLTIDGLEYYGQVNAMKGGILFADRVTTVSPRYAKEIQTAEFGCGLEGVAVSRADDLVGLINGIDTAVWNPAKDEFLPARYDARDLKGKAACRQELIRVHKLKPKFEGPVFGMVCRLTEQKGIDLLLEQQEFFAAADARLVVLGSGDKRFEEGLRKLVEALPGVASLSMQHDEKMSHLIEAGSDFFLMPSRFEPCGLNQMYSQAYGTIPVTSRVGGLVDTVVDADESPDAGTGITFEPSSAGLKSGLARAMKLFSEPERFAAVQQRAMLRDFSWKQAARAYEQLYQESL